MIERIRFTLNKQIVTLTGLVGVGLLPCPDCGLPLAVKVWPVAAGIWLFRHIRRRSVRQLDLLLTGDLAPRSDESRPPDSYPG